MVSNPATLEAFSIPREDDFPTNSREEMSRSGVEVSVEALVSEVSLAKTARSPPKAPSLIRRGFFGPRTVSPSPLLVIEANLEPPSRSPSGQNAEFWLASSTGLVSGSVALAGSRSAAPVSSPAISSSSEVLPGSATPLVSEPAKASAVVVQVVLLAVASSALNSSSEFLPGSTSHLGLDPGMLLGEGENNGSAGGISVTGDRPC
jgi:hypothetical protein